MSLVTAQYRKLFECFAELAELPSWNSIEAGVWLEALAITESSGNTNARHYDPQHGNGVDQGSFEPWASYGLFQIEGKTATSMLGLAANTRQNYSSFLYKPGMNTALAASLMYSNIKQYGEVEKALAAYNGGGWGAEEREDGTLNCQGYVDTVASNCKLVLADLVS